MSKQFLPIVEFASKGINSDVIPWDLPPSFLTAMRNVRILANRILPFLGGQTWATLPLDFDPGFIMYTGSEDNRFWVIAGANNIYVFDGTTKTDKTIGTLPFVDGDNRADFTGCLLSRIPVINHPTDYPVYWPQLNAAVDFADLPFTSTTTWRDEGQQCKVIRSHKQFLFAMNLNSNGENIPDGVRWSAPADVNSVPETWDPLDQTNVAGLVQLSGDGGDIVDGLSLRDAFCIYRQRSITVFDYVGGDFVWQIRNVSTTTGLLATDAIVEVNGVHYFIGDGDIYSHDGNSVQSIIHDRIKIIFSQTLNQDRFNTCYAIKNNVASEIWFCVPDNSHTYPNIGFVWNWRDDSWTILEIASKFNRSLQVPGMSYGSVEPSGNTWDLDATNWEDNTQVAWDSDSISPFNDNLIGVQGYVDTDYTNSPIISRIDVQSGISSPPYTAPFIERIGFPLHGLNKVTTITRIFPHAQGPGKFYINVGSQQYPNAPIVWVGRFLFDPDTMKKWDVRTTGELHCFRFESAGIGVNWYLSGIDVEYVMAGER